MSVETLRAVVDAAVRDERRTALRGLLQRPLLLAWRDRDLLLLVRRHSVWLQAWLTTHPGWSLHVDAELARLVKTPSALLPPPTSHPACDPQHGLPFGRKRYVGFCLALAACERAGRQITLQRLAEDLQGQAAGDPVLVAAGLGWPLESRADRGDMVAVGRLLLDLGVLERIHGDEEGYLAGAGDCLYTIRRGVLARLLAVRSGPSLIEAAEPARRLAALQHEPVGASEAERRRALRRHLVRALLERPVLYYHDLDAEAAAYLRAQQGHLAAELCEATGLIAEQRREGVALVDDQRELADFRLPQEGTDGHAALLLAGELARSLREVGEAPLPIARLEAFLAEAATANARRWRREATTAEGARALCHDLLDRLAALSLLRREGDGVRPLPAIARYALDEPIDDEAPEAGVQTDLFAAQEPTA